MSFCGLAHPPLPSHVQTHEDEPEIVCDETDFEAIENLTIYESDSFDDSVILIHGVTRRSELGQFLTNTLSLVNSKHRAKNPHFKELLIPLSCLYHELHWTHGSFQADVINSIVGKNGDFFIRTTKLRHCYFIQHRQDSFDIFGPDIQSIRTARYDILRQIYTVLLRFVAIDKQNKALAGHNYHRRISKQAKKWVKQCTQHGHYALWNE